MPHQKTDAGAATPGIRRRFAAVRPTPTAPNTNRRQGALQAADTIGGFELKIAQRRRIDAIKVGDRHRREMGDIDGLARSIADIGLLHHIVIRPDGTLIAGERRLRAAVLLGWTEIPVTIIDLESVARGQLAENSCRKDFTLSEAVAIKRALEPIERAAAQERMRTGRPLENFSKGNGRALDKIAKVTGISRITLARAEAVVDAAEAEPERFGKLRTDMDRTGRVNAPFKRLNVIRQAEKIRAEPPPLPGNGPYRAAMVDVPWAYEPDDDNIDTSQRAALPYLTMTIEQACALDVGSIMHPDAVLGFWVTNFILLQGLHIPVLRAWRFESKALATWPKDQIGRGHWLKGQTEHLVIATRGNAIVTLTNQTTLLRGPFHLVRKSANSSKPIEAYTFFESLCPAPRYADMFSRYRHNDKWDCHGDEAPATAEAAP